MVANSRNVVMEGMTIVFPNFRGLEGRYNQAGQRNFCVKLDDKVAEQMAKDGWTVKWLKAREEGDEEQAILHINVNFKGRPPRVVIITSRGRTTLTEDEIEILDWADIQTVDLIVGPYDWNINGKTGTKAYLQSMYVTINEDALELKYADVMDINSRSGRTIDD